MSIQSSVSENKLKHVKHNKTISSIHTKINERKDLAKKTDRPAKLHIRDLEAAAQSGESMYFKENVGSFTFELFDDESPGNQKQKKATEDAKLRTRDYDFCHPNPNDPEYKRIFKAAVCQKDDNSDDDKEPPQIVCEHVQTSTGISRKMVDTAHKPSETKTPQEDDSHSSHEGFCLGCQKPENEINFMGGLGPCIGNKRSDRRPQRPTAIQQIFGLRTGNYPLLSLTENPRNAQCPVPRRKPKERSSRPVVEKAVLADNVDTPTASTASLVECEEFDFENPMGLDLQGQDYRQTYEKDEQEIENAREYYHQLLHMKRRLMKIEIDKLSEERQRKQKYAVPEFFNIDTVFAEEKEKVEAQVEEEAGTAKKQQDEHPFPVYKKPAPEEIPFEVEPEKLAQLYRTTAKKHNISTMEKELTNRVDRYFHLWERRKAKENEAAEKKAEEEKLKQENLIMDLGEQFFEDLLKDKYQECLEMYKSLPPAHEKRRFPHTLRETRRLKTKMIESQKVIRDKAFVKMRTFAEKELKTTLPEADLIVPELTEEAKAELSLSEQSTDDEDDLVVGKVDDEAYQLRGFQYKLDTEPRGLIDRKPKNKADRAPRTCQSRSSWFRELVPDVSPPAFFQYNPSTLKKTYSPNDPDINLFPTEYQTLREIKQAPIREHLSNPPPNAYEKHKQIRFKVKRPKYIKVKKFNLTGYLYGARKHKKTILSSMRSLDQKRKVVFEKFFQQTEAYADSKSAARRERRHKRLRYLGIPYKTEHNTSLKNSCQASDSQSSDWIPEDDVKMEDTTSNIEKASLNNVGRSAYAEVKHHTTVSNMPAPKFREPTLRNHPRRTRAKKESSLGSGDLSDDSVSILSKTYVKLEKRNKRQVSPRAPYDVPRLSAVPPDAVRLANVDMKKTAYSDLFNARHHHDHADPTDHKEIRVRYKNKLPSLNTPEKIATAKVSRQKRPFEKAYPLGKDYKERDLSVPQVVYEVETKAIRNKKLPENSREKETTNDQQDYQIHEKNYKSRQAYEDNLPGKSDYIEAVRKMAIDLRRELENIKESGNEFAVNEKEYAEEILKEIASINSCVTSLESSTCTNFTNDSGSFLLIQDKKIPCDYITKSFVPFEEIDRVRIKASTADAMDEYNAPYYAVPFSGQKQDQINLAKATDKFYTFNQRSRTGVRKRLEVKTPDFRSELLGTDKFKAPSRLATEWDENYQHEVRNRPPVTPFKRRTTMMMLREGVRKKFETLYIRGQITEQQIVQQKETAHANEILKLRNMCKELFQKWQERHYHTSMLMIEKIKPFYAKTDLLKKHFSELERRMIKLNMRIVFIEDDWIRRTILQNFHYLIMEQSWRQEHDWIHLQEDGTLENFRVSINNRRVVNIRKRDRDDAWAIKEYYENVYLPNQHPIEIVFPDADTFNSGVNKLKVRTFICLLELHFSMWVLANLQHEYNQFTGDSERFIEQTTKFVKNRGVNRYFMENRAKKLKSDTGYLIEKPLNASIGSPRLRTIEPLCDMLYFQIIPQHIRNDVKEDCSVIDKIQMIFGAVIDAIGKLDTIPVNQRQQIEKTYRKKLDYARGQSQQACLIEKRIHLALEEIKRNMAPPYKRPPRTGKLPRVFLRKKKMAKKQSVHEISEKNKLFINAFTASDDEEGQLEAADSDILNSLQDNCIPFYFDHFLRLHDYEPNYDFKTQIELNEGPEENRLYYKDVLDDVMKNLEQWQLAKKKKMESDIQKTRYLYIDDENK